MLLSYSMSVSNLKGSDQHEYWLSDSHINLLVFSTEKHGFLLSTLYRNLKSWTGPTLLVVKDKRGHRFGTFVTESFKPDDRIHGGGECFVFRLKHEEYEKLFDGNQNDKDEDVRLFMKGLNRRWRIYRYEPSGQESFAPHIDAGFPPSGVSESGTSLVWDDSSILCYCHQKADLSQYCISDRLPP